MSHIERRQREKEEIRQRILEAARDIARKEGWPSVTIRKIADSIEYTPPIVYEYFDGKEALIKELIYTGFEMMKDKFEEADKSISDAKKLLHRLSVIHWEFANESFELYQLMFSLERVTPSKEMLYNMSLMKRIFMEIANNDEMLGKELLLSWVCLNRGAVSTLKRDTPPPHMSERTPHEWYLSIINRFINSI